ncbi:MAG TPA: EVE domain-containing protein [Candidatus Polarisedimenticolaceae bacterium]|nr:EVE domain-containing protein [Candidatus Polarisedimenticolaceae bacterium]
MARRYWLLKSDPDTFGLRELKASPGRRTVWDGVRNYQARNYLRDEMRIGDGVLFYHSRSQPPAVVATAEVVRAGYPDPTQFDRRAKAHDPHSSRDDPRWYAVDIRLDREFDRPVTLPELRTAAGLERMVLLRKGSRLSVQPVSADEWKIILRLGDRRPPRER